MTNQIQRRTLSVVTMALALVGATLSAPAVDCNRFKVWTFNVRFCDVDAGACGRAPGECGANPDDWIHCVPGENRRERAREYITRYDPDVFGLQEARPEQLADFVSWFPVATYGHYEGDTFRTKGQPIFWRWSRFTILDAGTFWLSCTPAVPESWHPSASHERLVNWVKLRHIALQEDFFFFNAHFPLNTDSEARRYSAALLRARIEELAPNDRVMVIGDLNMAEDELPFAMLTGTSAHPTSQFVGDDCLPFEPAEVPLSALALTDAYRTIDRDNTALDESTFHSFTGRLDYASSGNSHLAGKRIDFLLYNTEPGAKGVRAAAACIRRDTFSGTTCEGCQDPVTEIPTDGCVNPSPAGDCCYPSDHFASDFDLWLLLQDSWVDFSATGCETGKEDRPFNRINQGINVLRPNGTLHVRAGTTSEAVTINPGFPMVVRAAGGRVVIGD